MSNASKGEKQDSIIAEHNHDQMDKTEEDIPCDICSLYLRNHRDISHRFQDQLKQKDAIIESQRKEIQLKDKELLEKEGELNTKSELLLEKDLDSGLKAAATSQKDAEISELNTTIHEKDAIIAEAEIRVEEKDDIISQLKITNEDQEQTIADLRDINDCISAEVDKKYDAISRLKEINKEQKQELLDLKASVDRMSDEAVEMANQIAAQKDEISLHEQTICEKDIALAEAKKKKVSFSLKKENMGLQARIAENEEQIDAKNQEIEELKEAMRLLNDPPLSGEEGEIREAEQQTDRWEADRRDCGWR